MTQHATPTLKDPFDQIDTNQAPVEQFQVLKDRIEGSYYKEIVLWFFQQLSQHGQYEKVLEVGSGTGDLLNIAKNCLVGEQANSALYGVDQSDLFVTEARSNFPDINFVTADGCELPYDDNSFDLCFAATVLVHAPAYQKVFSEMVRVTKPGGIIAVLDQDFETATVYPGEREITRSIFNAACDFWANGWIGRELLSLMRGEQLEGITIDSKVRIDRQYNAGFFERLAENVCERKNLRDEIDQWLQALADADAQGRFFFSRNFYAAMGKKS